MTATLTALILLDLGLIAFLLARPVHLGTVAGRVLIFVALFVLPAVALSRGLSMHLHESKTTSFCLSCHVMTPYGQSLHVDDADSLPAQHFQNRRIDSEQGCYSCHTTYAMFGDLRAKLGGLRHLYVNYLGTVPETLELYQPYNNRECLHCHAGARSFEENEMHVDERGALIANETSCLECHDVGHVLADGGGS